MRMKSEIENQVSEVGSRRLGGRKAGRRCLTGCLPSLVSRKGSALLIVLGFLSFIIISGVSFAIYMRIERQAASNYRHSITARHLLNAGLARAMDEVDAELRVLHDGQVEWLSGEDVYSGQIQTKFPQWKDWPGRVKVSAVPGSDDNAQDARVLSLESLSFLPAVLLNDVRRFAVRHEGNNSDPAYMGAKWRPLGRSVDGDVIGRYAYVCVNVSDMLNVNDIRAAMAGGSFTNQASLGHLFANANAREQFDADAAEDRQYFSMQDFYAARYEHTKTAESSPYHYYLKHSDPQEGLAAFGASTTRAHVFITDGLAKADPVPNSEVCNIALVQPFTQAFLSGGGDARLGSDGITSAANFITPDDTFWKALRSVTGDNTLTASITPYWAAMIKDYLDTDSIVSVLNTPSVEMVPMISEIAFNKDLFKPEFYSKSVPVVGASSARNDLAYGIRLINEGLANGGSIPLTVEVVWPFKYFKEKRALRTPNTTYTIQGMWVFALQDASSPVTTESLKALATGDKSCTWVWQSSTDPAFQREIPIESLSETMIATDVNNCYMSYNLTFDGHPSSPVAPGKNEWLLLEPIEENGVQTFKPSDESGGIAILNGKLRVVNTMFLQVVANDGANSYVVDRVPCFYDVLDTGGMSDEEFWLRISPKLYFKTVDIDVSAIPTRTASNPQLEYTGWSSLEIADPRFNHKAANWVAGDHISVDGEMNQSTKDLLGKDGRDADIFMSVSDAGYMQSPGELGFIPRPYNFTTSADPVDFDNQKSVNAIPASNPDKDAMFRTFRLYDHGGSGDKQRRDFIYSCFSYANADGTLPGARVNPLSDLRPDGTRPIIQEAAIWGTPVDYWFAATNHPWRLPDASNNDKKQLVEKSSLVRKIFFNDSEPTDLTSNSSEWGKFRREWADSLEDLVSGDVDGKVLKPSTTAGGAPTQSSYTFRVNRDWRSSLSDVYGDWGKMKWYESSWEDRKKIFEQSTAAPLHEIDRKMLYAYSLDSFSDRQQLFLYFIRAEATTPAFGSEDGGSRSLSGGRAVALVWRDPYPFDFNKAAGNPSSVDNINFNSPPWEQGTSSGLDAWYPDLNNVESPWLQYYYGGKDTSTVNDPRSSSGYRWRSWHDARVLFFKQLDK